ncbi:exosortase-associated protein EpsI, B-type [Amantichitinum ursilacus]|uniref:Methanolan biosynthesis EpsI domain-containing protein n=1 Tax=Amantichitinum ursilacus TaxID=857265 RepID=A0A0N0XHL8_9NEIS|nr:exosortase-associated protein EpsI, B-type [Amantichitinum ursilacus]KPC51821.1 hypothetical protein WG78_15160 [Amantichitinum ursilacus]
MKSLTKGLIVCAIMASSAVVAQQMTPTHFMSQQRKITLGQSIPLQFGVWKAVDDTAPLVQSAESESATAKLYSQILSRTYVNPQGDRIMLLIAYGEDQRDNGGRQLHRPDICYPAQGFAIHGVQQATLRTGAGAVPLTRLTGVNGRRIEPVTFWTTIGDQIAANPMDFKKRLWGYGFRGLVPDGSIVRVSTISADETRAYALENQFIDQMVSSTPQTAAVLGVAPEATS